eukprot:TRINITY_DN32796_c0_g1_i2.p2 TRINITY_DN32796_c0_g1~~TRINITY_DN32796_c0_g1_i2.p2  ORF type:complete len:223 (-),score=32.03 TRINITY_DN32796_c0_g1_i2:1033-1701(-)
MAKCFVRRAGLLLLLSCTCIRAADEATCLAAGDGSCTQDGESTEEHADFSVVYSQPNDFGHVHVVQTKLAGWAASVLVSGGSIVGAQFDSPDLQDQCVFSIFNVMKALAFVHPRPRRGLMLGLGAGTIPTILRRDGISMDVVELNGAVIEAASRFFAYDRLDSATRNADARALLLGDKSTNKYDLIIHDVYNGSNPATLFSQEVYCCRPRDCRRSHIHSSAR